MSVDTETVVQDAPASPAQTKTVPRITLVTGGAAGIGAAIAERLSHAGHRIVLADFNQEAMDRTCEHLTKAGGQAMSVFADLSKPDAADTVVKAVEDSWGPVEILINNAGITRDGLMMRMNDADFDGVLNINLSAPFRLSKRCMRGMMKARWGRIVNIASVVAQMGNAGQANYVASKAGLIGLTKTLALELAPRGVTVNAVAPGFIETGMTAKLPEDVKDKYKEHIPLGRFGSPADVASLVAFFVSEEAAYITGQTVRVDGGMVMA
jgi:3-oxoacyl-[acyl-carrier protein] reductase